MSGLILMVATLVRSWLQYISSWQWWLVCFSSVLATELLWLFYFVQF